jgi:CheY-like chemotaxis protein
MNVLIVDDDAEMRYMARFLLEQRGDTVHEAADEGAAAEHLRTQPVDVVLMDVMLGGADGIDVAQRLIPADSKTPLLIYLTGATAGDQLERMYASNMAGVILKPFDPESFVPTLERLVSGARG